MGTYTPLYSNSQRKKSIFTKLDGAKNTLTVSPEEGEDISLPKKSAQYFTLNFI